MTTHDVLIGIPSLFCRSSSDNALGCRERWRLRGLGSAARPRACRPGRARQV